MIKLLFIISTLKYKPSNAHLFFLTLIPILIFTFENNYFSDGLML